MKKLKLDFEITRKPEPPGFVCALCDQSKLYWESFYDGGYTKICSHCHLSHLRGTRIYDGLSWPDQLAILVAKSLLKTITDEIKHGGRYTVIGGTAGPGNADRGPDRGFEGPEGGQDIQPRRPRTRRVGAAGSARGPLRCHGAEVSGQPRNPSAARVSALNIHPHGAGNS